MVAQPGHGRAAAPDDGGRDERVRQKIEQLLARRGDLRGMLPLQKAVVMKTFAKALGMQAQAVTSSSGPVYSLQNIDDVIAYFQARPEEYLVAGGRSNRIVLPLWIAPPQPPAQNHMHGGAGQPPAATPGVAPGGAGRLGWSHCAMCNRDIPAANMATHNASIAHAMQLTRAMLAGQALDGDSCGVHGDGLSVSKLQGNLPATIRPGSEHTGLFNVSNMTGRDQTLARVALLRPVVGVTLGDELGVTLVRPRSVRLPHTSEYAITVSFAPRFIGHLKGVVIFQFVGRAPLPCGFDVTCDTPNAPGAPDLGPNAPYQKPQRKARSGALPEVVPAPKEEGRGGEPPFMEPMGQHSVPTAMRKAARTGGLSKLLQAPAGARSAREYADRLKKLLWAEELQLELDVQQYDLEGVEMTAIASGALALAVPGLAENRPCVMRGDTLRAHRARSTGRHYEGRVVDVQREEVLLRFDNAFHCDHTRGMKYNVNFVINRGVFRLMHCALARAADGMLPPATLSPGAPFAPLPRKLADPLSQAEVDAASLKLSWSNTKLNAQQKRAVVEVLRSSGGAHGGLPYYLYGPPGTGKTMTLVEVAGQLLRLGSAAKVLGVWASKLSSALLSSLEEALSAGVNDGVGPSGRPVCLLMCAPSNSAADQLAERLLQPGSGRPRSELLRVCAYSRSRADVPATLLNGPDGTSGVTNFGPRGDVEPPEMPRLDVLLKKRVIVCTLSLAAKLFHVGIPRGHFSHVLVDEAGHAEEPLQLCALAGLVGPATHVVLAGDPRQLGPIVHCRLAQRCGLDVSAMEKHLVAPPYARPVCAFCRGLSAPGQATCAACRGVPLPYNSAYVTKLLQNYRSHPDILYLPNKLFYQGELLAPTSNDIKMVTHGLCGWEQLPAPHFPLVFHGVAGKDEREGNSPSWFNVMEIKEVCNWVEKLQKRRGAAVVTDHDIGIITPYRKQVQKLRFALAGRGHNAIRVTLTWRHLALTWRLQVQKLRFVLAGKGHNAIRVGSVEEFQGMERRVIIISTVRSSDEYISFDAKHRLGFLKNPKRFNVAITRAKALVVVVGNPDVLVQDDNWRALLRYIAAYGGTTGGKALPPNDVLDALDAAQTAKSSTASGDAGGSVGADATGVDSLVPMMQVLRLGGSMLHTDDAAAADARVEEQEGEWLRAGGALVLEGGEMRRME